MNGLLLLACVYLVNAPLGYVAIRWSNRVIGVKNWTRFDRLGGVLLSLIGGPWIPVLAVMIVLIDKLSESGWAKRDAGW